MWQRCFTFLGWDSDWQRQMPGFQKPMGTSESGKKHGNIGNYQFGKWKDDVF